MLAPSLLALVVTVAAAPAVLALLRRLCLLDVPNCRSSHDRPIPRGGGLAPAMGILAAVAAFTPVRGPGVRAVVFAAVGFGLVGLLDDVVGGVAVLRRLGFQVLVAAASLPLLLSGLTGSPVWQMLFAAGVVAWLVSYVNSYNFMDGINGIAAVQALVAGLAWCAIAASEGITSVAAAAGLIAAAAVGFLPFNFPTARMFLGDVGSYFVGAWLAAVAVIALRTGLPLEAVFAPLAPALADTGTTLLRRLQRGENWYRSHRDHTYQRLVQLGWSHVRTTVFVGALVTVCSVLGAASMLGSPPLRVGADVALAGVLVAYLAAPMWLARAGLVPSPARS